MSWYCFISYHSPIVFNPVNHSQHSYSLTKDFPSVNNTLVQFFYMKKLVNTHTLFSHYSYLELSWLEMLKVNASFLCCLD